jgi:hypothetical protein
MWARVRCCYVLLPAGVWVYFCMGRYRCQEALDTLALLPPNQFDTGWVLAQCGRAHLEMANYKKVRAWCTSYAPPPCPYT